MKIEKSDLFHSENLIKLLKKASVNLEGDEILAAAESYKWFLRHFAIMKEEFSKPQVQVKDTSSVLTQEKHKKKKE